MPGVTDSLEALELAIRMASLPTPDELCSARETIMLFSRPEDAESLLELPSNEHCRCLVIRKSRLNMRHKSFR
jgi:hypothetical protein